MLPNPPIPTPFSAGEEGVSTEGRRSEGVSTRGRCVWYVPRELRAALGVSGSLETNVAAELASSHPSPSPPQQAYLSRTVRDDQDLTHPSPFGLSSPVVSSKHSDSGARAHDVSKSRTDIGSRALSTPYRAPPQALQPSPGADIRASDVAPCTSQLPMTCI